MQAVVSVQCPSYRQRTGDYDFCSMVPCTGFSSSYLVYPLAFAVLFAMMTLYAFTCRQIYNCRNMHGQTGHRFQQLASIVTLYYIPHI